MDLIFSPCKPRKPRKNTTKYGSDAKIPTKRANKQDKEPKNPSMQAENPTVQAKNAIVQDVTVVVPIVQENSIVVTSPIRPTKETILQESPIRLTRG
jgi:hypothetical protein